MIHVYHATPYNPSGGMATKPGEPVEVKDFPDAFMLVATVDTDDLEVAWERTNTIERAWVVNDGVQVFNAKNPHGGHRSTSMGDVMVKDGEAFVAVSVGFQSIGDFDTGTAVGDALQVDPGPDSGTVEVEVPVQVPRHMSAEPYQVLMARHDGTVCESWIFTSEQGMPDLEDLIEAFEKDLTQGTIDIVHQAEADFKEKGRNILEANRKEAKND
jgi:hypothetical protein